MPTNLIVKTPWGLAPVAYATAQTAMQTFTQQRSAGSADELWFCVHPPMYSMGLAAKAEHLLTQNDIAIVRTDRGGQVTYHGPGQLMAYTLIDLHRLGIYVKELVYRLESAIINTLRDVGLTGHRIPNAPGVYIKLDAPSGHGRYQPPAAGDAFAGYGKVAALGVKITKGRSYHGLCLNLATDLAAYQAINPCGYAGLRTVNINDFLDTPIDLETLQRLLAQRLSAQFAA